MAKNESRGKKQKDGNTKNKPLQTKEPLHKTQETSSGTDGEDFSTQHESLHKQIVSFEKLLQHAMNRFSRDKLFNMLKLLSKCMVQRNQLEQHAAVHIDSVQHLKAVIHDLRDSHAGKTLVREEEKHLVQYFSTFFEDLEYLHELKRYFDEKVYICLYEYFYDPFDDVMGAQFIVTSQGQVIEQETSTENPTKEFNVTNNNDDTKVVSQATHSNKSTDEEEEIVFDFLSKEAKLSLAVQQMYKVNLKWDLILDVNDPHLSAYDPDSKHELAAYSGATRYEPIMRLLPDMFVKAYKSIEMAKLWWGQASKLYSGKPVKKRTITEIAKEEVEIEHRIEKISEDIARFETTIVVRSEDLEKLSERENRFQALSEQCEKLEERKDLATQAYNTILAQVKRMDEELDLYQKGTKKYIELEKRLKETDKQLALTQDELKILAYHFHIVQEDFNLEMELQPHLIRFRADIEGKMIDLEIDMRVKQTQKHETQKRLVLLKANCERMHEIMQRYNITDNSRATTPTRENTSQVVDEKGSAHNGIVDKVSNRRQRTTNNNQPAKSPIKKEQVSTLNKGTISSNRKVATAQQHKSKPQ